MSMTHSATVDGTTVLIEDYSGAWFTGDSVRGLCRKVAEQPSGWESFSVGSYTVEHLDTNEKRIKVKIS